MVRRSVIMELTAEGKENFQKGYNDPWDVCNRTRSTHVVYLCSIFTKCSGILGKQNPIAKDLQVGQLAERMTSIGSIMCALMWDDYKLWLIAMTENAIDVSRVVTVKGTGFYFCFVHRCDYVSYIPWCFLWSWYCPWVITLIYDLELDTNQNTSFQRAWELRKISQILYTLEEWGRRITMDCKFIWDYKVIRASLKLSRKTYLGV